tara:strand:+ start:1287 stop:2204 length:918 start_codon:yes stop_codon:yes gene_type:complete
MIFDVIIVGAGLSGCYLAKKINELGLNTLIIEKSKSIGGRFSTKPVGRGLADYGCQYLKPKTKDLSNLIQDLKNKNLIKKSNILQDDEAFIAPYGMNKIPQYLSLGVSTLLNQKVSSIKKTSNRWEINTNSFLLKSKMLVLTMPINQVSELLKVSDLAITNLPAADYKSFFTITFQDIDTIGSKPVLKNDFAPWICNNFFKGLSTNQNTFTVNINEELSNTLLNLEDNKKHGLIKRHLKESGFKNFSFYNLHYWKYAFTEGQNNITNYYNEDNMLALCGDSFSIGQADGAVVSAQKTFEQIRNIF